MRYAKEVKPLRKRHSKRNAAGLRIPGKFSSAYQILALTVLILIGILIGTLLVKNNGVDNQGNFSLFLQSAFSDKAVSKDFSYFISSFFSSSLLLCAAFFLGLCLAGLPGLLAIPLFLGAGIGYTLAYLYSRYGIKGIAFSTLCILPQAVLTSVAVVLSCREGIRFSFKLCAAVSPSGSDNKLWDSLLEFCYKFVFCFIIVIIAALLEALATMLLSGLLK